jgi:hypothetical protein
MVRFRRRPFEDLQEPFAAEPLAPAALPTAALPFVQQLRLHLASDGALHDVRPMPRSSMTAPPCAGWMPGTIG